MIELPVPTPYDFRNSIYDHGWAVLAPCSVEGEPRILRRVERLHSGEVVLLSIEGDPTGVRVSPIADHPLTPAETAEVRAKVRWMLKLDEDFTPFYRRAQAEHPALWATLRSGRGRLLRSPTLWEDVVKTICTTNVGWKQTKGMVRRLVDLLGDPYPLDPSLHAFPTPEQVAAAGEEPLRRQVTLGYRSGYVLKLAEDIASGRLDLEALRTANLPADELYKALRAIKGVGDYAAGTLLMILGAYGRLAYDTELRSFVTRRYFDGVTPSDKEIAALYAHWGEWQYLAYWFDAMSEWEGRL